MGQKTTGKGTIYMSTFKLRLRFKIANKGVIKGEGKEFEFTLPNGHEASLHAVNTETISDAKEFVILSGGYSTEETALQYGYKLKDAVLCYGTLYRVGVDVGKDKASTFLAEHVKEKILNTHGVKMIDDVHGITVYNEDFPTSSISTHGAIIVNARDTDYFSEQLCDLISIDFNLDDQIKLAMELMTSSFFESSPRARFLTLVLAAESVLSPEERSGETKRLVDDLKRLTEQASIDDPEKRSVIGTLNWLYKDSISTSLKKMALCYLPGNKYDGTTSVKFIKKCYEARSKLVHSGAVDESKYNVGTLAANLELYMKDMLTKMANLQE